MQVLVINCGSSSIKYSTVDSDSGAQGQSGRVELGGAVEGEAYAAALAEILRQAAQGEAPRAIGHRVVHGGPLFRDAVVIDDEVLAGIEAQVPLAPLHNPANLTGIRLARQAFPDLPHVAVFDTAFHARMPRRARTYAIDTQTAAELHIQRYGFHGTSHRFVSERVARHLQTDLRRLRLISCHLGNGASVCAVEFGRSLDTSMGMTPLEGLAMGSRCGDIDAGAVLALARSGKSIDDIDHLLNKRSGLLGVSGLSSDMRTLEQAAADGHDGARLAIGIFAHRVRKAIGGYAAIMGGVDAVIMTGGIGENSAVLRRRILERLEFMGLCLDEERNHSCPLSRQAPVAPLTSDHSQVQAFAVVTDEAWMIAQDTARLASGAAAVANPGPIPIAVSARHIHLDQATFASLFGDDAAPTKAFDLSQPGQFACEERLTLIGPRGRIERVRLLGPLRGKNQVEVSRTDEFNLGVDAPVRRSGRVEASAPITLETEQGTRVHLEQGLICAWRHIHMTPADAERFAVQDGDEVEVAITGGPRDLVFGDVLVRVKSSYRLEMHIDTDEANAAELPRSADGELVYTGVDERLAARLRRRRT